MDANLSVRTMGFVNILFYRDQSSWLRSGETLQTHQTESNASRIPRPQWPIKPCITLSLCKRNGSSMWVSLHQHLTQITPHGGQGLFRLMGYQGEPLHHICMPLILGQHDAGIGEQGRYCVKRSKQLYGD